MMNVQASTKSGAVAAKVPFTSTTKRSGRGVATIAAGEPDRAGVLIAVCFVFTTLLAMTVALGYAVLIS